MSVAFLPGHAVHSRELDSAAFRRTAQCRRALCRRTVASATAPLDEGYMARCLELAGRGAGQTRPNPPVGCVLVNPTTNQVVGEGFHPRAGQPHAEVYALRAAGAKAEGATAYVSLEPCNHFGRTPPCSDALVKAKVGRVVVGMVDPDPRTSGKGVEKLREAGIEVDVGVLGARCEAMTEGFVSRVVRKMPFGTLKYAMTLDGKIAADDGSSRWVSGPDSREVVHRMRMHSDAIIVGGNTLRRDDPMLNVRLQRGDDSAECLHPLRVVMTRAIDTLPVDARMFEKSEIPSIVMAAAGARDSQTARELIARGVEVVELNELGPRAAMQELYDRGALRVLWECGGNLAAQAVKDGCVQRVCAFIAPKLVGGGLYNPVQSMGLSSMSDAIELHDVDVSMHGGDILVNGLIT